MLEWFDWYAYLAFNAFFAVRIFPPTNHAEAILHGLEVFAIGFVFRPIGGILLGNFTDHHGRRAGLTLSVSLMAVGSLVLALTPTYSVAGIMAPIILVLARACQGLSTGGEFAAIAAYLLEIAPARSRGLYSSFTYVTGTMGLLVATLAVTVLPHVLSPASLSAWGWRIPFGVGAILGLCGLYLRLKLDETEAYLATKVRVRRSIFDMIRHHPASCLRVAAFTVAATAAYYSLVNLPMYAQSTFHVPKTSAAWILITAELLLILALVPLGKLCDIIGRKPLLITFAASYVLLSVPLFALLGKSSWHLLLIMCVGMLLFALYAAPAPTVMAELFPTQVRSAGLGFPYSITVAIFGGTVPSVIDWLTRTHRQYLFPWYISILSIISLIAYITSRETKDVPLQDF